MKKFVLAAALIGLSGAAVAQTPPAPPAAVPPPPGLKPGYGSGSTYAATEQREGIKFDQWAARARERLMALDTNHDGRISKDEFAARGAMMGRRDGGAQPNGDPPRPDGSRMFDRFDADHDGYLDAAEINALLARRFARMDANHDGVLTADERGAMRGMNAPEQ